MEKKPIQPAARPVKTPIVLQMESVECGAASLATILAYHGRFVTLEELRVACGVSRDGLKASNLLKGAREYGLIAKGYAKSIENLMKMQMPCIIFWNFNHFVTLEGFSQKKVHINDPAQGRYKVDYDEFDGSFTGVVMTFEPGPNFQKGYHKTGLLPSLASRIAHSKVAVTLVLLVSLFLVIPGLVIPSFTQIFIDQYLVNQMDNWVRPLLLAMFLVLSLNVALTYLQQYYLLRLETKLALSTSSKFLWHVLHLPMTFYTQRYGGEVSNRVTLNDKVARLLAGDLANAFFNAVIVVFFAAVMFSYSVVLTTIGIAVAGINILVLRWVARVRKDGNRRLLNEQGKLLGTTMSGISMIETLKASGRENDFFANWSGYLSKVLLAEQEMGRINWTLKIIPSFLSSMNIAILIGIGAMQVMNGQMTIGMLVAFMYLMNNFVDPVNKLTAVGGLLQETEGDMNRIDDVLAYQGADDFQKKPGKEQDGQPYQKLVGSIEIRNLTFGYSKTMPSLINDFSLKVKPGGRVALVGGSGSGKSTMAKLLAGLYNPWEGQIFFDHQPREDINPTVLYNSLALVDQDILLFEGKIRDNLAFWESAALEQDIIQAAKDADIHDVIAARHHGYDGKVAERGGNFSGGQRQRIEIARALTLNPTVLILDEATSALDPQSEKIIMDNIRRRGCTCIIVAHRLSTIKDCDEIVVLDQGSVVQRGTHEDLMKEENGAYAKLLKTI